MQTELNREKDGTIELTATLPWSEIKEVYDDVVNKLVKEVEVKGFRKGKAPRKLAEEKLDEEKVWQHTLERILPQAYTEAIEKEDLRPIVSPEIQLLKAAPENDLVFKAKLAEEPKVELGDYRKAISDLKGKTAAKIWTPGDDKKIKTPKDLKEDKEKDEKGEERIPMNKILEKLLEETEVNLPEFLIERETNNRLSQLIDEVKQVGMTIKQYAESKGKSVDKLREETKKEVTNTLKLEFILEKIAEKENVTVDDKEVESVIQQADSEQEKENLANQRYYITSLLRRQKTLQKLLA